MSSDDSSAYFSICYIEVNPGKMDEAQKAFEEVAEATLNEPGAKIYRFYQTEGKNEFVSIEKFTSREAYAAHVQSDHVRAWAEKYLDSGIFAGSFKFHPLTKSGPVAGGFDRP
ncbi:antibiotic biosynthesis [Fusarium albosuccineum]|uniref:Antibiotic biosynthesis n=1 Tax=Fusarium albosuccineum TaxID=1237068 RepID=A0A8H4PCN4_9HYPO|nr:antibiotic biosynthesis [Fusarium albosuccineum]